MSYSFHKPGFDDIKWIKEKISERRTECCDFTPGNLIGWSRFFGGEIGSVSDCLVVKIKKYNSYSFPKKLCEKWFLIWIILNCPRLKSIRRKVS